MGSGEFRVTWPWTEVTVLNKGLHETNRYSSYVVGDRHLKVIVLCAMHNRWSFHALLSVSCVRDTSALMPTCMHLTERTTTTTFLEF